MRINILILSILCSHLLVWGQTNLFEYNETLQPQTEGYILNRIMPGEKTEPGFAFNKTESWSTDFTTPGIYGDIYCSTTDGTNLYLGGSFKTAGNKIANNVAFWDGQEWHALGEGIENGVGGNVPTIHAMAYAQGKLFVGGQFARAGSHFVGGIAFWDGTKWNNLGDTEFPLKRILLINQDTVITQGLVYHLFAHGNKIYVGGDFQKVENQYCNGIAAWDINLQKWETLGSGITTPSVFGLPFVDCIAALGSDIYIGGYFQSVNGVPAQNLAKWNGSTWQAVGNPDYTVNHLQVGPQGRLYASGIFTTIDGVSVNHGIAYRENGQWYPTLESNEYIARIRNFLFHNDGLLAIGTFEQVATGSYTTFAKWENGEWVPNFELSFISNELVQGSAQIIEFIQNHIYIAGSFTKAAGLITNNVIEWQPQTSSWKNLEENLPHQGMYDGNVLAFAKYQGDMYIGGTFDIAGGTHARRIAKWNGTGWQSVGESFNNGVKGVVIAMAASGSDLFVGGYFGAVGSVAAFHVGKWNGTEWSPIGIGVGGVPGAHVNALAVMGNYLYVGGYFTVVGDADVYALPANSIARFNLITERWESLGQGVEFTLGLTGEVYGFDIVNDSIIVVGDFNTTDGQYSPNVGILVDNKWENVRTQQNIGLEGKIYSVKVIHNQILVGGILQMERNGPSVGIAKWNGKEWETFEQGMKASNNLPFVNDIQPFGNGFIAGGYFQKAGNVTANNIAYYDGQEWISLGEGVKPGLYAIEVSNSDIFVGGPLMFSGNIVSAGIAKFNLEATTSAYKPPLVKAHLLEQNYPNPSNQTTWITYHIPSASQVTLEIFDAKGQRIMVPVKGYQLAGTYTLELPTIHLPSGIYFYRLASGSHVETKKMIVGS